MNFEVRGGKVYKDAKRESHGSNWERIESAPRPPRPARRGAVGSNWERIESKDIPARMAEVERVGSNWERIERQRGGEEEVAAAGAPPAPPPAATGKELKDGVRAAGGGLPRWIREALGSQQLGKN